MRPRAKDEVGEGACEGDEDALPAGVGVELAGVAGGSFAGVVAGHLDVATEGENREAVVGVAARKAEEAFAEADGEDFDADAAQLSGGEVAELVDQHHDAKDDEKLNDCRHEERGTSLLLFAMRATDEHRWTGGHHFARTGTRGKICF